LVGMVHYVGGKALSIRPDRRLRGRERKPQGREGVVGGFGGIDQILGQKPLLVLPLKVKRDK